MGATQDTGSVKIFTEGKEKMITISGVVEQEWYNNNASYNAMVFISIQAKNQQGQGFSKDSKVTTKLEGGEAMRFANQVKGVAAGAGEFKKAYQTDTITFEFAVNLGASGPQMYIQKNQQSQGSALTVDELLEISGYVEAKYKALEVLVASYSAGMFQFTGKQGTQAQNNGGGYQQNHGGHQNQGGYQQSQGGHQNNGGYQNNGQQNYGEQNGAPSYGGNPPQY